MITNYTGNYMGTKNSVLGNYIGKNKHPSQAYPVELVNKNLTEAQPGLENSTIKT